MSKENNILVKLNNVGLLRNQKWLVKGVSLTVEKGQIVTLIGPNGSGKSTTAKIAIGIHKKLRVKLKNSQIKLDMFLKKYLLIGLYRWE